MNILHAVILGIVEGFTEFLPISSTAHLQIASNLLILEQTEFVKTFEIAIQSGAILAVVFAYWNVLSRNLAIWKRIVAAFIPTAIIGLAFYKVIKQVLLGNDNLIIWTLGIGGVILIVFEYIYGHEQSDERAEEELQTLSFGKAIAVGIAQAIAVVPGVSRSAATIVAGRLLGMSKQAIVEFSFLLAVPTIIAAAGYDLLKSAPTITSSDIGLLIIGGVIAFFAALVAIRSFMSFVKNHSFVAFGVYRIILAILLFLFLKH